MPKRKSKQVDETSDSVAQAESPPREKVAKKGKGAVKKSAGASSSGGEASSSNGTYLPLSDADKSFTSEAKAPNGKQWNLRISSWNINGIRAWLKKDDGLKYIKDEKPDMILLQETKCSQADIPSEIKKLAGYEAHFSSAEKAGYAGTGLLTKQKPLKVTFGMGIEEHDQEGRLITAEFKDFYLIGAYVPNSGRGLPRLGYRQVWNKDFLKYITDLDKKKPVIYTGDLNVAHSEIDLKNPQSNAKTAGFTKEEREDFTTLLKAKFFDSFRELNPERTGAFSFWAYFGNSRASNTGWRLDYFILSERLKPNLADSLIRSHIYGSDHCPITLLMAM